jgi:ribosome-binding ATPase
MHMKLSLGIVGLPNVGKSTLFKILTKQDITIANYPFATIDPNVGVVAVPDERVDKLAALSKSRKKIPAVVEFYDIAGLVKGANKGEGLGNQFLAHIRETQAIVLVLRIFAAPDIIHVENSVDAARDLDIIMSELMLKDLDAVEKRLVKAEAEARSGIKTAITDREELTRIKNLLNEGKPADATFGDLNLLTAKRRIFLLNGTEADIPAGLIEKMKALGGEYIVVDLAAASGADASAGGETAAVGAISGLIKKAYETLGLASFFTTGEDETRAWTIERGTLAPQAAGVIHTDFEKKFIRLEVVAADKLLEAGGWAAAKQKGWVRVEGKEYEVKDGDVMVVRHG